MSLPEDIRRSKRDLILVSLLTLVALVTRIYGIWSWSLIGDEYYTITYAAERSTTVVNPAFYVLVLGSFKLFGLTEWSARLPSVILGVLSVPVFYITCQYILDRKAAFIGSLFIIVSGWHLYHAQLSRFYSGVFLFGILSYLLYYQALRRDSYWYLGGALFSNVLGILFHATSIMVPASCAVYSAVLLLGKKGDKSGYSKRVTATHLILCGTVGLISLPFFVPVLLRRLVDFGSGPLEVLLQVTNNVEVALAVSSFFGLLLLLQKDFYKGCFFALGIGIPLLALFLGSALIPPVRPKYIFYTLPLMMALSAFLCAEVSSVLAKYRITKYAVTGLVIAGMMPGFVSYYTGKHSLDVREAITFIDQGYEPGDKIIAFSHSYQNYLGHYPDENVRVLGGKGVWREALIPYEDGGHRVWILLDTYRNTPIRDLEAWLMKHASLVWRRYEKRYDYSMMGYEIYLVNGP